jgi:hemolysin activation/secretion protein
MKFRIIVVTMLTLAKIPGALAEGTATNAPAPSFAVHGYVVTGNTALPQPTIDGVLSNYTGTAVTVARLREGLGKLQLLYRNLGFATISVTLPQQKLTNGLVQVKIIEGRLGSVSVTGNRFFSSNNVLQALPGVRTNVLLNTRWFQPELDAANANRDRQIYPVISPGPELGMTDIDLRVKDRLPLHGHVEVDDKSTPGTPLLRVDTALEYNNLWQDNHQIGIEYNFSPQAYKSENFMPRFFDQPAVDSYSGFYRMPLAGSPDLATTYNQMPVDFGYDQVTHQFRLPPPTGMPELIVYAARDVVEIPTRYSPITTITNTSLLNIAQQSAERDLTFNDDLGVKLSIPLREIFSVHSSVSFGIDFKAYQAQSFNTNLTYASVFGTNQFGNRQLVSSQTIPLAANSGTGVQYMPLSLGWSASRADPLGSTTFNVNQNIFLAALSSGREKFEAATGAPSAGGNYTTITAGTDREESLPRNWSLSWRADGQWANESVINTEEFALGGTAGVRGYREGEDYGDTGWRSLFDLHAPAIQTGSLPYNGGRIPVNLRSSLFMDFGETWRLVPGESAVRQWGTGLDILVTASDHFAARLTIGRALLATTITHAGNINAYFSVGFQF